MGTLGSEVGDSVVEVQHVLARIMRLPMSTVAAVQGHAFAAGAMLALAHDVRVMRSDRGYFCLPEIDLGLSFSDGFAAIIQAKLAQPALHRLAVLGERLDAPTGVDLGFIDVAVAESEVLPTTIDRATTLAPKASPTIAALRANFYGNAIESLAAR